MLKYRLQDAMVEAFIDNPAKVPTLRLSQLDPAGFLSSPGLWIGLVFAAACLAAAVRLRRTSKADLIAVLKDAFAYCDKAYDGMTDASAARMVKLFGRDTPKLSLLSVINMHSAGHYGNLVTYMRLKNIVPPTSEPGFNPLPPKK